MAKIFNFFNIFWASVSQKKGVGDKISGGGGTWPPWAYAVFATAFIYIELLDVVHA